MKALLGSRALIVSVVVLLAAAYIGSKARVPHNTASSA